MDAWPRLLPMQQGRPVGTGARYGALEEYNAAAPRGPRCDEVICHIGDCKNPMAPNSARPLSSAFDISVLDMLAERVRVHLEQ